MGLGKVWASKGSQGPGTRHRSIAKLAIAGPVRKLRAIIKLKY